ncbi:MAG: TolC family protein [Gammaproteobacteria bacterium]|nr:TolC family protein [Gammaproteobacteria bacterium]
MPFVDNYFLRTIAIATAVLACLLLGTSLALIELTPMLSLKEAEQLAVERDPDIQAFITRSEAFEHLAASVTELPDAQVRAGLMNYPLEHGNFRTEGMTHSVIGVRQSIPPRGLRPALFDKNEYLAREQDYRSANHALEITNKVRHAWLDASFHERRLELILKSKKLFGDLLHLARTLYSTGDGNQSDILQIELEQFKIEDRILEAEQDRDHAYISLREYIGEDSLFKVSTTLPNWNSVPPFDDLRSALTEHPIMLALTAQADANAAQVRAEESGLNRKWMIDLSYAYRDGGLLSGQSRSDLISASISFNLPIWGQQKYRQRVLQVQKMHSSTLLKQQSTLRELEKKLDSALTHWKTLSSRVTLYEEQILPKTEELVTVNLESYENQANNLSDVVQSHINQIEAELKHLELTINRLKAWADIDKLVGLENI